MHTFCSFCGLIINAGIKFAPLFLSQVSIATLLLCLQGIKHDAGMLGYFFA